MVESIVNNWSPIVVIIVVSVCVISVYRFGMSLYEEQSELLESQREEIKEILYKRYNIKTGESVEQVNDEPHQTLTGD